MSIQAQLAKGIKAAKHGDKSTARDIFYEIVDHAPKNEMAWVWLSYVVDSAEDRQICLENVLTINPNNLYARRGLSQLRGLAMAQPASPAAQKAPVRSRRAPLSLNLVVAFWAGIGLISLLLGASDIIGRSVEISNSRNFPRYITSYQLLNLIMAVTLFVVGVIASNLAWALYKRHRSGYYISIVLSLGLTLVIPTALLILERPNYALVIFATIMPALILFLTLMSQTGSEDDS